MVTQIIEPDQKELRVVFEKKAQWQTEEANAPELECEYIKKAEINALSKKQNQTKVANIFAQLDKAIEHRERKIVNIGKALQSALHRESLITDKFLSDVESMVTRFNTELDKIQDIFGNIIKNLPQVQVDTDQKNIEKDVQNVDNVQQ